VANDRFGRILRTATEKAKEAASVLREEFTKGTEGDTSPTPVLFGTTGYDQIKALLRRNSIDADLPWDGPFPDDQAASSSSYASAGHTESDVPLRFDTGAPGAGDLSDRTIGSSTEIERYSLNDEEAAAEVSGVLQRIDWKAVSAVATLPNG
jgi:hypothetical protein